MTLEPIQRAVFLVSFGLLFWSFVGQANATLIGDVVTIAGPGVPGGSTDVTVGDGVELTFNDLSGFGSGPDDFITINIGESSVEVSMFAADTFWGWQPGIGSDPFIITLTSLNWVDMPSAPILELSSTTTGFFAAGLGAALVGPNAIDVMIPLTSNGATCGEVACGTIRVDLISNHIPEPSTLLVMGLGLLGLCVIWRHQKIPMASSS